MISTLFNLKGATQNEQYQKLKSILKIHPEANDNLNIIVGKFGLPSRTTDVLRYGDVGMLIHELEQRLVINPPNNEYTAVKVIIDSMTKDKDNLLKEYESLKYPLEADDDSDNKDTRCKADARIFIVSANYLLLL